MRIRLFGAVAALVGCAAVAVAQQPVPMPVIPQAPMPAPGMTPVPVAPALPPAALPATPAAPPVMYVNPDCGTPASAACGDACEKRPGLFSRFMLGSGTANPLNCGCLAAERTFLFGNCRQFFTPGKTCCGDTLEYGPGGMYKKDNCKNVTSFLNR